MMVLPRVVLEESCRIFLKIDCVVCDIANPLQNLNCFVCVIAIITISQIAKVAKIANCERGRRTMIC